MTCADCACTATNSLDWGEGQRCSTRAPTFNHVLRPGFSQIAQPNLPPHSSNLNAAFHYLEAQLKNYLAEKKAA